MSHRSVEVAPGVWSLPVAMSDDVPAAVHAYALEADAGLILVDAGFGTRASLASLEARLAEIGGALTDVRGVLFTHAHPDHYGLSGVIKERSDAWLALHPADRPFVTRRGRRSFVDELAAEAAIDFGPSGSEGMNFRFELPLAEPDVELHDGQVLELAPWRLTALHTPGHTPGHTCFRLEGAGVILLGDHVLARTTPNVSHWPGSNADPLGDYLTSLRRIGREGAGNLGLPGHEGVIEDIPARAAEVLAHHETQCAEVTELVRTGHDTIGAVATRMSWSREWPELGLVDRIMAVGEAHAHLRTLETRGALRRIGGPPPRFVVG